MREPPRPEPPSGAAWLTPGDPLAGLGRWIGAGQVDAAARARARQHWLRRQAEEQATLGGVLVDLAERGQPLMLSTRARRRVAGPVRAVGADFCIVREQASGDVVVPMAAIATVRPAPGEDPVTGDRHLAIELVLAEALVELAADRPAVLIATGHDDLKGELRSAGRDVVAVVLEGPRRDVVYVSVDAIDHLVIRAR